jgi:hypothetical protein
MLKVRFSTRLVHVEFVVGSVTGATFILRLSPASFPPVLCANLTFEAVVPRDCVLTHYCGKLYISHF